jgi:hypothetical protein
MPKRTSNTTGIGVRNGTASYGGFSTQPIPFVLPTTFPVNRPTSPITSVVATDSIANSIENGLPPALPIPISSVMNGTMNNAVTALMPSRTTAMQYRPSSQASNVSIFSPSLNSHRRPNEETLSIARGSIENGEFQTADAHGINQLRPEIIGLMDYSPIYFGDSSVLNDVGLLMDIQYQTRHLREQTFFQLLQGIQQADRNHQLQEIQTEFTANFRKINTSADFYKNTTKMLESIKNGFDLKNIPNSSFDLVNFKTMKDFYESFMMFPRASFDSFSGTKVLMQLLFDMRSIAENNSMNLLDLTDSDRQAGGSAATSPINIDKSYNSRSGFSFTYDTVRSFNQPINASETQFFTRFNSSLPQSPDDRIKILVNMISKELRVSRALGRSTVISELRQKFNATTTDGSPFDNLLGGVGTTIFDPVTGVGSIASLAVINDSNKTAVLPFETKYIDVNNTRKVYVPGSTYFVDSIVNMTSLNSFNLNPLRTYVETFTQTTDSVASLVSDIFDYGDSPSELSPVGLLKRLFSGVSRSLTQLMSNTQRSGQILNVADAATAAIFRLAASDASLKSMLFQYVMLSLLSSTTSVFFKQGIIYELDEDIRNLSYVTINDTYSPPDLREPSTLQTFINALGVTIQNRVSELVSQQSLNQFGGVTQNRSVASVRTDGKMLLSFDVDTTYGIPNALNTSLLLRGLNEFVVGLETTLGNETNNILDSVKRTRFNSLSTSTMMLVIFEAYTNLVSKYVRVDFQTSIYGQNFPDMLVDTNYNAQMQNSIEIIISSPELALPVIVAEKSTAPNRPLGRRVQQTQRSNRNAARTAAHHAHDQINETSRSTGASTTDVYHGLMQNESILTGPTATAGTGFTDASQYAFFGVSGHSDAQVLLDSHNVDRGLNSLVLKLFQEDFAVACAMHILLTIKERLRSSLDTATNYFTQQTLSNLTTSSGTALSDISKNLTPTQVRLLLRQRDLYVSQLTSNSNQLQFIPNSSTDVNVRSCILSLLNQASFRDTNEAGLRYRLLTVGIPSGFSKNLADRINGDTLTSNSFQRTKNFDLIYVKVYKRSLEFPQVVFKPRRFLFDMSLFPNGYSDLNIRPLDTFESILQRASLKDYQNYIRPRVINLQNIIDDDGYSSIPDPSVKRGMFQNHVVSDLLTSYIQSLTTMRLNEMTFVDTQSATWRALSLGDGTDLSPKFSELARRYLIDKRTQDIRSNPTLRPLPDLPIQEMLTSPSVDQGTKDTLKLLTFGNIAFKPENALAELLSPKVFERVFTIPLNVDSFEIDHEATTATESGREFMEKGFVRSMLDPNAGVGVYKFKPRTHSDSVIEDYFVTIELVE